MTIVETKFKMSQRNILVCFSLLWDAYFALNKQKSKSERMLLIQYPDPDIKIMRMMPKYDIFHDKTSYVSDTRSRGKYGGNIKIEFTTTDKFRTLLTISKDF